MFLYFPPGEGHSLTQLQISVSFQHLLYFPSFCFSSSSTFKDPERASLRDSGHGDSDQADSDQDTNKGSCCDMSAKEALKLKATGIKPAPLEQGELSLAISPATQMNAVSRALGPNDYQLAFFSVPLELLNSDTATLFSSYFVLCSLLTLVHASVRI